MAHADPGSFRDPLSRVYLDGDEVLRGLSPKGLADYERAAAAPFFAASQDDGLLVRTELLPAGSHPLHETWAGVLRHERLPVVTYPYEWTFEMLRDAALVQLEVTRRAVRDGLSSKDATSFNVTFRGNRPTFLDIGSFEPIPRGEPWSGYGQFCRMFLNPLVIQAATDVHLQPLVRGSLDGISARDTAALVPLRKRLRRGLAVHVGLQARAERRYADHEGDIRQDMARAGFNPKIVLAQLDNLEKSVRGLKWRAQRSEWSDYSDRAHYGDDDLATKERVVADAVAGLTDPFVVDLGANDGRFSMLAVAHGARLVLAPDVDHLVADRLYRHLRSTGEERILPLVVDLADPAGPMGWRSMERRSFRDRVRPDLVLCLAVVHHLALTNTVPLDEIVDFLADFDAPIVVEFPHRDDVMVERLLSRKRAGLFDHYDRGPWERALERRFLVDEAVELPSGTRTLYRCRPR